MVTTLPTGLSNSGWGWWGFRTSTHRVLSGRAVCRSGRILNFPGKKYEELGLGMS